MMAVSKISQELVVEAYEYLKSENINPSLDRIRERLGTGSKGTIQAHLKAHLYSVSEKDALANVELPAGIISALQGAFNETSDNARVAQAEQHKNIVNLLEESDLLRKECEDRLVVIDSDLKNVRELLEAKKGEHVKEKSMLNQKIIDVEKSLEITSGKLDNSIVEKTVLARDAARGEVHVERADEAAKIAQEKVEKMEIELNKLKAKNSELEKKSSTFEVASIEKSKAFEAISAEHNKANLSLVKQLSDKTSETNKLASKVEFLQIKIEETTAEKSAISEKLAVDMSTILTLEKQLKSLSKEDNKPAINKK